jgi:arylsulfatase
MPDDVGYGDYACLGNPIMHTPSVDAFKKESLLLTQFHVSPTCAPTRAALMSGRHEFKNGVTHTIYERERMSLKTFMLPQMLKSAGYTTGIFGKWHLGAEEAYRPENRGFDEVYIHGGGGIGQTYPGSCGDAPGNSNINPALWHNGKWEKTTGYCTDLFFAQATKWMDARRHGKQWLAVSINGQGASNQVQLLLHGTTGRRQVLQVSSDLFSWVFLATNSSGTNLFQLIATHLLQFSQRFYRAVVVP